MSEVEPTTRDVRAELRENEERLRLVQAAGRVGSFDWNIRTGEIWRSAEYLEIQGLAQDLGVQGRYSDQWQERLHPEDRERVVAGFREDLARGGYFEHVYRIIRPDNGETRWIENRGRVDLDADGKPQRLLSAQTDITARKQDELRLRLLVNELNHRVKNTLATVQSIATQTLRNATSLAKAQEDFEHRLLALARAHDILTRRGWAGADLSEIVAVATEAFAERTVVRGGPTPLPPQTAVSLAMALHELAVNAIKYGALSAAGGRVEVEWRVALGRLTLSWRERDGPPVRPPSRRGFGSRLIQEGLAHELGGEVSIDYRPEGVVCVIRAPLALASGEE